MKMLFDKMERLYEEKMLRNKLREKYGDDIIITSAHEKKSVVCFKNTGYKVLTNAWYDSKKNDIKEER
jgi:uncharacterized protein YktA (UPF0223 family)